MSRRLLVMAWHNIEPTWAFPGRAGAGARGFARQLRLLRRYANVVRLPDALDDLAQGRPLPPRAVALTFDDGYRDNVGVAAPLLKRFEVPATFFLVPGLLSQEVTAWWEELAWGFDQAVAPDVAWEGRSLSLATVQARRTACTAVTEDVKRLGRSARAQAIDGLLERLSPRGRRPGAQMFLDWDDAAALRAHGHDVGSHTMTHPILATESALDQETELRDSRRRLEAELGVRAGLLAYPNGGVRDYDATTLRLARLAGYRHALTTRAGWVTTGQPPLQLRRWVVDPYTGLRAALRDLRWLASNT